MTRKVDILHGLADRASEKKKAMEETIFAEQDSKARARKIHRQIDELLLTLERYHEMLERVEEMILEMGREIRVGP